jgi:hypothetical protein
VGYALTLRSEVGSYLLTLPVDLQEDLWDLFDALVATLPAPAADTPQEVELHLYLRKTEREIVALLFPLVIDHQAKAVLIPSIAPLHPA